MRGRWGQKGVVVGYVQETCEAIRDVSRRTLGEGGGGKGRGRGLLGV